MSLQRLNGCAEGSVGSFADHGMLGRVTVGTFEEIGLLLVGGASSSAKKSHWAETVAAFGLRIEVCPGTVGSSARRNRRQPDQERSS